MQATYSNITLQQLEALVHLIEEEKLSRRAQYIYDQVPTNNCQRCTNCCFSCAQVYPLEFLLIYAHLKTLPELTRARIVKKLITYEMLNMVTLDYVCPFLEDENCAIYAARPLQCHLFGLYPEVEYEEMVRDGRNRNHTLAMFYARNYRIELPKEVMTYDVEQCKNNIDEKGKLTLVTKSERDRLHEQIYSASEAVLPEEWLSTELIRYSFQFALLGMSAEELEEAKHTVMKEYQASGKSKTLKKLLGEKRFSL